mgnify:FL=1
MAKCSFGNCAREAKEPYKGCAKCRQQRRRLYEQRRTNNQCTHCGSTQLKTTSLCEVCRQRNLQSMRAIRIMRSVWRSRKVMVTLCATAHKALEAWEQDESQTIIFKENCTLWIVGPSSEVWLGHEDWYQTSPEELIART